MEYVLAEIDAVNGSFSMGIPNDGQFLLPVGRL
jgi:hypothetical protein